jgi:MSHA biogenesis protein MshE
VEHDPSPRDRAWIEKVSSIALAPTQRLQQASGCHRCNNTGYRGRTGIFELLVINDEMADALRRTDSSAFVKAARASRGYQPLVKSAVLDAIAGVTSLDEVFIVAEQIDETGEWVFEEPEHE